MSRSVRTRGGYILIDRSLVSSRGSCRTRSTRHRKTQVKPSGYSPSFPALRARGRRSRTLMRGFSGDDRL